MGIIDDDVPCKTCGKLAVINIECDWHCIRPTCNIHFPENQISQNNESGKIEE